MIDTLFEFLVIKFLSGSLRLEDKDHLRVVYLRYKGNEGDLVILHLQFPGEAAPFTRSGGSSEVPLA